DEILYEAFTHPSRKTCTYAVLFHHLNNDHLFMGTLNQLDSLWNRWANSRIGPTLSDIQTWEGHTSDERVVFDTIWEKVRVHFDKRREPIDTVFRKAKLEFSEKIMINKAIKSTLYMYCDKAIDYFRSMNSIVNMF